MTDQTEQAVAQARAAAQQARAAADQHKEQCLAAIADGLPAATDRLARRAAQAEPDAARRLGQDGIRDLKNDLSASTAELAADIGSAAERIDWPDKSRIATSDVHTALFNYLYGPRLARVTKVLTTRGLIRQEAAVLPQELYDEKQFAPLVDALNAQALADATLAQAQRDDDLRAVDDLWDNT
jgi:hypothetical protein